MDTMQLPQTSVESAVTATYKELLARLEILKVQTEEARKRELKEVVAKVRATVEEFGLSPEDVFPPTKARSMKGNSEMKVAPKYRDPATGATWTGRGKPPKWIQDQDREKFAIQA